MNDNSNPCKDCGIDTIASGDYYMTEWTVWEEAHSTNATNNNPDGYLCIPCLENRLGRVLTASDFLVCPTNAATAVDAQMVRAGLFTAEQAGISPVLAERLLSGLTPQQDEAYTRELESL